MRIDPAVLFDNGQLAEGLKQKSVHGGMTTMVAQGVRFLLQMASTVILARLLTPDDYGLVGMVAVITNFAQMFMDAGLSMATVQKDDISREQISTLFWVNVTISVVLGCCILAAAPLVALFYGKPELVAVTAVLSIPFIVSGMSIQHAALLQRHMRFGALAIIGISAQVVTLVVTILLAVYGFRYWSLVWGSLVTAVATVSLTFVFCPWVPGKVRRGTGVAGMLRFGGHLTAFNFIDYFTRNADKILIGRIMGAATLGLYVKAYQLFMLPIHQIRGPLTQVAVPVLSSLKDQPKRFAKYYERMLAVMAAITVPLMLYCAVEAEFLIRLLLGSQWLEAVPLLRIFAIAGLIRPSMGTAGLVLISLGRSKRYLKVGAANGALTVAAFVLGVQFGVEGVVIAFTVQSYLAVLPVLLYCFHKTPISTGMFFRPHLIPLFASVACLVAACASRHRWAVNAIVEHLGIFIALLVSYVIICCTQRAVRETAQYTLSSLRMTFARG